jgi:hypothetical protein
MKGLIFAAKLDLEKAVDPAGGRQGRHGPPETQRGLTKERKKEQVCFPVTLRLCCGVLGKDALPGLKGIGWVCGTCGPKCIRRETFTPVDGSGDRVLGGD